MIRIQYIKHVKNVAVMTACSVVLISNGSIGNAQVPTNLLPACPLYLNGHMAHTHFNPQNLTMNNDPLFNTNHVAPLTSNDKKLKAFCAEAVEVHQRRGNTEDANTLIKQSYLMTIDVEISNSVNYQDVQTLRDQQTGEYLCNYSVNLPQLVNNQHVQAVTTLKSKDATGNVVYLCGRQNNNPDGTTPNFITLQFYKEKKDSMASQKYKMVHFGARPYPEPQNFQTARSLPPIP